MHKTAIALLVFLAGATTACNARGDGGSTPRSQTLSPGEPPTSSGGTATDSGLKSVDGSVTVDASGRFSASG